MKSNKCLFSKTVFKSNILRFLPFAAPLFIAELIVFPVSIYNTYSFNYRLTFSEFVSHSIGSDVIVIMFAAVFALLSFSYLFKPNSCNALHAFPVGRRGLFVTSYLSGYTLLVVPQLLAFFGGLPMIIRYADNAGKMIVFELVSAFGISFIAYTIGVLAAILAGNFFAGSVLYLVINFIYYALKSIIEISAETFGKGLTSLDLLSGKDNFLSPFVGLLTFKTEIDNRGNYVKEFYTALAIIAAVCVVLIAIAMLLYKVRQLECAGDMVAFKAELLILSVLGSIVGGAMFTMFIGAIFSFGNLSYLVSYVIFSLVFYFAVLMVLKKTGRVFRGYHFGIWLLTLVLSVAVAFGYAAYATNYIPDAKAVESATVSATYDIELTDAEELQTLKEFHKQMIKDATDGKPIYKTLFNNGRPVEEIYSADKTVTEEEQTELENTLNVTVTYELKSGRNVIREYTVYKDDTKARKYLAQLEATHSPVTVFDKLSGINFTLKRFEFNGYGDEYEEHVITGKDCERLFKAAEKTTTEAAANYTSSRNINENEDAYLPYSVFFFLTVDNIDDYKKLDELEYYYDVTGCSLSRNDDNWDKNSNAFLNATFEIDIGSIPVGSELEKTLKSIVKE